MVLQYLSCTLTDARSMALAPQSRPSSSTMRPNPSRADVSNFTQWQWVQIENRVLFKSNTLKIGCWCKLVSKKHVLEFLAWSFNSSIFLLSEVTCDGRHGLSDAFHQSGDLRLGGCIGCVGLVERHPPRRSGGQSISEVGGQAEPCCTTTQDQGNPAKSRRWQ